MNNSTLLNKRVWIAGLLVAALTFAVYLPSLNNDFVNWDDDQYVYENKNIHSFGPGLLKNIFSFHSANWHPLTWLSHAIDYAIWGLNPIGHHLGNVILHSINVFIFAVLVIVLIMHVKTDGRNYRKKGMSITGIIIAGGISALLFGIHPLQAESVAWVSERKNILATLFFLLGLVFYVKYVVRLGSGKKLYYPLSLFSFVLALMSKPIVITLPVVLIMLDIYPFRRLDCGRWSRVVFLEKAPFFFFIVISSVLTIMAQHSFGAIKTLQKYDLITRCGVAVRGLCFYLWKMVFPVDLYPYYPHPEEISFLSFEYAFSIVTVLLMSIFCLWAWRRGWKVFAVVWVYYLITLSPVLGIIQVGTQAAADRYFYIPGMGVFLLIGIGALCLWEKNIFKDMAFPLNKIMFTIVAVSVFSVLGILTLKQIGIWRDSVSLWGHELRGFPWVADAYYNRAKAYMDEGRNQEAIKDLNESIRIKPGNAKAYNNRANAYIELGEYQNAIDDLSIAVTYDPLFTKAFYNRSYAYIQVGDYTKAIQDIDKVIEYSPEYPRLYYRRAYVYMKLEDYRTALRDLDKAVELKPEFVEVYINRCVVYKELGDYHKAVEDCTRAIDMAPNNYMPYNNRGLSYYEMGEYQKAITDYTKAIGLAPDNYEIYRSRGVVYRKIGKNDKALSDFQTAAKLGDKESLEFLRNNNIKNREK